MFLYYQRKWQYVFMLEKQKGKEQKCHFKEENGFKIQYYRACIFIRYIEVCYCSHRIEKEVSNRMEVNFGFAGEYKVIIFLCAKCSSNNNDVIYVPSQQAWSMPGAILIICSCFMGLNFPRTPEDMKRMMQHFAAATTGAIASLEVCKHFCRLMQVRNFQ